MRINWYKRGVIMNVQAKQVDLRLGGCILNVCPMSGPGDLAMQYEWPVSVARSVLSGCPWRP